MIVFSISLILFCGITETCCTIATHCEEMKADTKTNYDKVDSLFSWLNLFNTIPFSLGHTEGLFKSLIILELNVFSEKKFDMILICSVLVHLELSIGNNPF